MLDIKTIGVLAYHRCSESDTIIPWEILMGAKVFLANQGRNLDVKLVALKEGPVEMQMGAKIEPHAVLRDGDLYDLLYVPGGNGSGGATKDKRVLDTIK